MTCDKSWRQSTVDPRISLHVPISRNRGGILLPQLYEGDSHDLYDTLRVFLSHTWHFDTLFGRSVTGMDPEVFLYLLVCSTWETNFRFLDREIKRIGLYEIREPSTNMNNSLHDRRRDLCNLQDQVEMALTWMPDSVHIKLRAIISAASNERVYIGLPGQMLSDISKRSRSLEQFLMESFNILISSTSVVEAELAVEQGIRSQRLAILAFLYVPLSFVTGIYGMNVKEINGGTLSIWVAVVTLAVTLALTTIAYLLYIRVVVRQSRSIGQR